MAETHHHRQPHPPAGEPGYPVILFFVCGEGLGHTSRCLKAAQYCEAQGALCHLAAYGQSHAFLTKSGWPRLCTIPREVTLAGNMGLFCIRKTLWNSKAVPRDLARSYRQAQALIAEIQPDIVIADTMYAPVEAARRDGLPVLFITNQNRFSTLAGGGENGWAALGRLVSWYLTLPDKVIIPDFAPPVTVSRYNIDIPSGREDQYRFTGPLIDISRAEYPCTEKTIFASFGGEPFKIPLYRHLAEIAGRRSDLAFEVFAQVPGLPDTTDNFRTHGYVPDLLSHLCCAEVAILHGGLTTLHEALFFGKPVVMIIDPHHPEQGNNARAIIEMGAGVIIRGDEADADRLEAAIEEARRLTVPDFSANYAAENGRMNLWKEIQETLRHPR
ncbi:glycosyltransferase family protein [Methanogenium organophilum]|uniref:Glycosyltransferase n=1 Tax=Methanogenium organophilum TaxID=2199 RepID=A0A9X9S5R6_METOG|nr:glycosyltransferase family protein [Methanogenium organophilum]WAI02016.1 glycosyltransferase [Methanogenium organophilum]